MKIEDEIKKQSNYNLDYSKISPKINYEKYSFKKNNISKIFLFFNFKKSFAVTYMLMFICLIFALILSNFSFINQTTTITTNFNNSNFSFNILEDEFTLIGIAAYKEFEEIENGNNRIRNINNFKKSNNRNTDFNISYSFEYIKIKKAIKFCINTNYIPDEESRILIEEYCGIGKLELVVAEFDVYEKKYDELNVVISDTLISLRGNKGYYSILANSGGNIDNDYLIVFSSHKKILNGSIVKNSTSPILTVFLKEYNLEKYLYFKVSEEKLSSNDYNPNNGMVELEYIIKVSKNTIYSIYDLAAIPTKIVEVKIKKVEDNYIIVENNEDLLIVYYTDYTEGVGIGLLEKGDKILIEFDYLFDGYNPYCVKANNISYVS